MHLEKMLIDRQITTQFFNDRERQEIGCIIEMLDETPAADVVPRKYYENVQRETTRNIFEDIRNAGSLQHHIGMQDQPFMRVDFKKLCEIRKKYMEGR